VAQPDTRVIVGARGAGPDGVEALPLDLASLASVRTFAKAVQERLGGAPINMLVLNAGAQYRKAGPRSADGFEPTFAVNHLAHYLLARLLLSSLADGGRLVITTSDTHDPAILPFAPKALDPQRLAHPDKPGFSAAVRAYSASKLCNLLTARAFAALDEVMARRIQVIAYNPGLTLGTKLGRAESQRMAPPRAAPNPVVRATLGLVSRFKSAFYPGTLERAGEVLAQLALGTVTTPPGRIYASLVKGELTFPDPSALARSDEARDRLWRDSAAMVGLD
jgi:NAD(P)-dependent dehydrogenase (short-subunit alcohol dehydrogenase family)